jgi:hypothetical protein
VVCFPAQSIITDATSNGAQLAGVNRSHAGASGSGEEHLDEVWVDEMEARLQLAGPDY